MYLRVHLDIDVYVHVYVQVYIYVYVHGYTSICGFARFLKTLNQIEATVTVGLLAAVPFNRATETTHRNHGSL